MEEKNNISFPFCQLQSVSKGGFREKTKAAILKIAAFCLSFA